MINWLIKPFTMAALGYLFFKVFFAGWVDPQTANEYIAGMILLGVAPCTAMVFVWSQLTKGNPNYTLVQVAVNDVIMIFAFAPIAAFLLLHPEHRHAIRRAQITAHAPYSEIRDNTISADLFPVDLLRVKLAFFGATHFDPRSDRWLRICMFGNAPYPEDLTPKNADYWVYPEVVS